MSTHGHHHDRGLAGFVRYARHAPRMWRSAVNRAVVDVVAPQPGERVLDIGAGYGPATVVAAGYGAAVVAVEPTAHMRAVLAVRRLFQRARKRIVIRDGAAENLGVTAGSIDAAWSTNAMHHWTDVDAAVAEITRAVRSGGRLVLVDEDFDDPDHELHDEFDHDERHAHGMHAVDIEAMGARLESAGWTEVDTDRRRLAETPVLMVAARRG